MSGGAGHATLAITKCSQGKRTGNTGSSTQGNAAVVSAYQGVYNEGCTSRDVRIMGSRAEVEISLFDVGEVRWCEMGMKGDRGNGQSEVR